MTSPTPPYPGQDCAIVVLGAALRPDGTATPALAGRVARGVELLVAGAGEVLVVSGGAVGHPRPEAEVMAELARDLARARGLADPPLILEAKARNTRQNARYTRDILVARGVRRAVVVTDLFHLPRALWVFHVVYRGAGIRLRGRAAPGNPWRARWWAAVLREAVAFGADLVRAWKA